MVRFQASEVGICSICRTRTPNLYCEACATDLRFWTFNIKGKPVVKCYVHCAVCGWHVRLEDYDLKANAWKCYYCKAWRPVKFTPVQKNGEVRT